jgi:hypothetical protein
MKIIGIVGLALFAIPMTILLGRLIFWSEARVEAALQRWAQQLGCRIVDQEKRLRIPREFWWTVPVRTPVYYLTLEDSQGYRRYAWVWVGDWLGVLRSDEVHVAWDEQRR